MCGALPVHDHAVWNEDAVQISAVVGWGAEQVQTVAGPVVPELGEPTPEPLLRCTFFTRFEKSHNFTVRMHQIEQKPSLPRAQSCPNAQLRATFRSRHCCYSRSLPRCRRSSRTTGPRPPPFWNPQNRTRPWWRSEQNLEGRAGGAEEVEGEPFPPEEARPAAAGGRHGTRERRNVEGKRSKAAPNA